MRRLIYFFTLWLALFTLGISSTPLTAQTIPAVPSDGEKETVPTTIPKSQRSPRDVLKAFIDRMRYDKKKEAVELLDLSDLRAEAISAKGPELAYQLYTIIQRVVYLPSDIESVIFESIPGGEGSESRWSLADFDEDARVEAKQITITRDDKEVWRFSTDTVDQIESLYEATKDLPRRSFDSSESQPSVPFSVWLRSKFPEALHTKILILPIYQWLCLTSIALISYIIKVFFRREMTWITDKLLQKYDEEFKESTISVWKPVGRLLFASLLFFSAEKIGLPLSVIDPFLVLLKVFALAVAVWSVFAIADLCGRYFTRRAKRQSNQFNHLAISLGTTTVKLLAIVIGIFAATITFIPEWTQTVVGGFGIGGVAIALASQESLSNFIGSLSVLFDSPFVIGDWVIVNGIEGEVESVGFRSTRIRTGMNSQVTIPNSQVAKTHVDNLGRRRYRRYLTRIGVEYKTTTEQMRAFCEGIQELIRRQPHTRKDFYAVYFNDFGDSSLEIILVCYFEVSDWPTELRERHRLLLDIVTLAEQLKVTFAFPTQTIHLYKEEAASRLASIENPETAGQTAAADIAGELLNYQDRPMPVKFPGPTS